MKSIIKLGGEKLEWGRNVIETGFIAFEKELDSKTVYSVGDQITMAGESYHFFLILTNTRYADINKLSLSKSNITTGCRLYNDNL